MISPLLQIKSVAPEWVCWRIIPQLVEIHTIGNLVTFAAYALLGATLLTLFVRLAPLSVSRIIAVIYLTVIYNPRFVLMFVALFGVFITMCGISHYGDYYVINSPEMFGANAFLILGEWKIVVGIVSMLTALSFLPLAFDVLKHARRSKTRALIDMTIADHRASAVAEISERMDKMTARLKGF